MNFLSHYYLLESKNNTAKVVGNLLPDLMRGFTKIYRQEIKTNQDMINKDLMDGIHFHLLVDKLFHKHDFFLIHCEYIKALITRKNLESNKSFIVAHVMLELIIDQYLMEKEIALADNFYLELERAIQKGTLETLKFTLLRQNSSEIMRIFKSFIEHRYAYRIQDAKGLSEALQHIVGNRISVNFRLLEWHEAIEEASITVKAGLPDFLKELKQAI